HENEIAQSEAYSGKQFVKYWLHCQHLVRDGQKMSKSKGNTISVQDLTTQQGVDPMALRMLLLSTHYRKMLNFTSDALHQAESSLQRIRDFLYELGTQSFPEGGLSGVETMVREAESGFVSGLSDDLNISTALSAVFGMIKKANILMSRGEVSHKGAMRLKSAIQSWDRVLGILSDRGQQTLPADLQQRIDQREQARVSKDFALADRIRDELLAQGIVLEDTKEGVRWKTIPSSPPKNTAP
ncbi:MAG: DALR domain-containing protein, partial [Candidatus Aminicenantaceae bacterium]